MNKTKEQRLEEYKKRNATRYHKWWTEGKKDGMCSVYRDLSAVPKSLREAYTNGHIYGSIVVREVA